MNYSLSKILPAQDFQGLKDAVTAALKKEGFGVLTEIDIQATMKSKLDKDYRPFLILGACNPVYADKVLSIDPQVSTMLPCNVCLRELESGEMEVSAIDPIAAMGSIGKPEIEEFAAEVQLMLQKVLDRL